MATVGRGTACGGGQHSGFYKNQASFAAFRSWFCQETSSEVVRYNGYLTCMRVRAHTHTPHTRTHTHTHTHTHEHCMVAIQEMYIMCRLTALPHLIHSKEEKVPLWVVAMFCNQGDNTGDAIAFADQFNKWTQPSSSGGSAAPDVHRIHTVRQQYSTVWLLQPDYW